MPNIEGLDRLFRRLDAVAAVRVLEPPMWRSALRLQRYMQVYPPKLPNSTYRWTGTLGRRWTAQVTTDGSGVTGRVGNNTRYAPFVQSARFQQRPFRGRWRTDAAALDAESPRIRADFARAVRNALDT